MRESENKSESLKSNEILTETISSEIDFTVMPKLLPLKQLD